MTDTPTTLTYTLEQVLERFEQRVERQLTEISQKLNRLESGQIELAGQIKTLSGEIRNLVQGG